MRKRMQEAGQTAFNDVFRDKENGSFTTSYTLCHGAWSSGVNGSTVL